MILSITNLRKNRPLEQGNGYTLVVPELTVQAGEKILITGPSGSGKSTFLDLLGMVLCPDGTCEAGRSYRPADINKTGGATGTAKFFFSPDGKTRDIVSAWRGRRDEDLALWRRHIGYVLQTGGMLPFLTVRENIALPRNLLGLGNGCNDNEVTSLAGELNIAHLLDKLPSRLSVGERQRAAIARALAASPALVLADEPTAALDPENSEAVLNLFTRMVSTRCTTLILVTHAPEQLRDREFRHLHIVQKGQGACGREAILIPASLDKDRTLPESRDVIKTISSRNGGLELTSAEAAISDYRADDSPGEVQPSLAELASMAALAQISGMASPEDMHALSEDPHDSEQKGHDRRVSWTAAQASWRGPETDDDRGRA